MSITGHMPGTIRARLRRTVGAISGWFSHKMRVRFLEKKRAFLQSLVEKTDAALKKCGVDKTTGGTTVLKQA